MNTENNPPKEDHGFWPIVGITLILLSSILVVYVLIVLAFG